MVLHHPRSHFVGDLVPIILESDDHWWPQDLLRLAQVSSAWLEPVRRRLYSSPTLYSFRACSQLARTLSDNPTLLPLVKNINLRPMSRHGAEDRQLGIVDMANLRCILALEGLLCITLGGLLSIRAQRFLHSLADTYSVIELHIDGSLLDNVLSCPPSLEWDEGIAFKFPSLKKLHLTNIELDIVYPSIPYQLQLSELVLDTVVITSGYLPNLLSEMPSIDRLCVLSKSASDSDEHIRLVLVSCAVRTLEYEVQADYRSQRPIFDIHSLPSLHSLRLSGVRVDLETLNSIGLACQNLEELSISGRAGAISPDEWVLFINSGALPALRCLGLPWGTNQPPFKRWSGTGGSLVLKAAAARGIRLSPFELTSATLQVLSY